MEVSVLCQFYYALLSYTGGNNIDTIKKQILRSLFSYEGVAPITLHLVSFHMVEMKNNHNHSYMEYYKEKLKNSFFIIGEHKSIIKYQKFSKSGFNRAYCILQVHLNDLSVQNSFEWLNIFDLISMQCHPENMQSFL